MRVRWRAQHVRVPETAQEQEQRGTPRNARKDPNFDMKFRPHHSTNQDEN
jgi:hypothetical protein